MPTSSRLLWYFFSVGAAFLCVTGCCEFKRAFDTSHDCRQDQAGSAHVAVLSIGRWTNYRDALAPGFKLTADQALAAVVPNTADLEEKSLEATSGSLKVALPTGSTPGDTSKITLAPAPGSGVSLKDLGPSASVLANPTAVDPFLRYGAATALLQEVALLDSYLKDAASDPKYEPYIVRLQVTLLPKHRDAAYDAYSSISFFTGPFPKNASPRAPFRVAEDAGDVTALRKAAFDLLDQRAKDSEGESDAWKAAKAEVVKLADNKDLTFAQANAAIAKILAGAGVTIAGNAKDTLGIKVIPLIVTDDIEMTSHSNSDERMRQFALALSAVIHGIGASGELQQVNQNLRTLLGHDFNSEFTVARASDNTLRVRFGAYQQVSQKYSMLPQTHNVTVLLLIPKGTVAPPEGGDVHLMAKTVFTSVRDGADLEGRAPSELLAQVREVMKRYAPVLDVNHISQSIADQLLGAVDSNDHRTFGETVRAIPEFFNQVGATSELDAMWVDIALLRTGGQYGFQEFHVPARRTPFIEDTQSPSLVDDGTATTTISLFGNKDLDASKIDATLLAKKAAVQNGGAPEQPAGESGPTLPDEVRLAASSVSASSDGRQLTITFPSLSKLHLEKNRTYDLSVWGEEIGHLTPMPCVAVILTPVDKPKSKLFAGAKVIMADATGHGMLELTFATLAGEALTFTIDGADVGDPKNADGSAPTASVQRQQKPEPVKGKEQIAETGWQVKADGTVVFPLSNLSGTVPLVIQPKVKKTGGTDLPMPAITLPIQLQPPSRVP